MAWALFLIIIYQNGIHAEQIAQYSDKEICEKVKTDLYSEELKTRDRPSWTDPKIKYECLPVPDKQ